MHPPGTPYRPENSKARTSPQPDGVLSRMTRAALPGSLHPCPTPRQWMRSSTPARRFSASKRCGTSNSATTSMRTCLPTWSSTSCFGGVDDHRDRLTQLVPVAPVGDAWVGTGSHVQRVGRLLQAPHHRAGHPTRDGLARAQELTRFISSLCNPPSYASDACWVTPQAHTHR